MAEEQILRLNEDRYGKLPETKGIYIWALKMSKCKQCGTDSGKSNNKMHDLGDFL